jgi:signal transduction histidine kinase
VAAAYRRRIRGFEQVQAMRDAFSRQLIDSQEAERKRIAAELHDSVGHTLIVINNQALAGVKASGGDTQATARWGQVSTTASAAIEEVREIAHNLGPYQLDRLGLADTVLELVDRMSNASGISFTTEIDDVDGVLPKTSEVGLYRIIQESVNNIVKHSHATSADIRLSVEPASVVLAIADNGVGFEAAMRRPDEKGFGLQGLRERARMLGGTCEVESMPGSGTSVTVRLPCRGRS